MSEPIVFPTISGVEIQVGDVATAGSVAGLADDRVLAELLRLPQYNSALNGPYKAIVPSSVTALGGSAPPLGATAPTNAPVVIPSTQGNLQILPFRAIVGPRNAANLAPSPNPAGVWGQTNFEAAWRDVRSGVFSVPSVPGGSSAYRLGLAPNGSGNPRWDLVYAAIQPDANGPSVTRRVKGPSTGVITATAVAQYLSSPVTIGVVPGTPGATPTPPVIPTDAAGSYYLPLAWVRVPSSYNGAGGGAAYSFVTTDIRSTASANSSGHASSRFRNLSEPFQVDAATGNNDIDGSYSTNFPWNASAGGRPGPFLPPDIGGGRQILVEMDCQVSGSYSLPNGSVVDSSIDWRNRMIMAFVQGFGVNSFANDPTGGTTRIPAANGTLYSNMASTFSPDGIAVAGAATALVLTSTNYSAVMASGSAVGLIVDMSTGQLLAYANGTAAAARIVVWLMASGQFPNY